MRQLFIVNKSTHVQQADFANAVAAIQTQLSRDFAAATGINLQLVAATAIVSALESIILSDTPDVADALGYHEFLESTDAPTGFVFPALAAQYGESWSSVLSHEVLEQARDPECTSAYISAWQGKPALVADEVCDPVQNDSYKIGTVEVSNFVLPSWFDPDSKGPHGFDFLRLLKNPLTLRPGGYVNVSYDMGTWDQVTAAGHPKTGYRFHPGLGRYARKSRRAAGRPPVSIP